MPPSRGCNSDIALAFLAGSIGLAHGSPWRTTLGVLISDCFLGKVRSQETWFASQMTDLKREYGIGPEEDLSVEGVIVASQPMLWVFAQRDGVPVLDDYEFYKRLSTGRPLVSKP